VRHACEEAERKAMNGRGLADAGELVGRMLLGLLFVIEAFSKIGNYAGAGRYMTAYGVPAELLPAVIALELGAGIMIMAGWYTRIAALALSAFCLAAAVIFHTEFSDGNQFVHFLKDIGLAGAFLVVWARGAGPFSVDAWRSRNSRISS
jgi:putative oxidoreductase